MSIRKKIPIDASLYIILQHQEKKLPICVIRKRYPGYSTSSVLGTVKNTFQTKRLTKRKPIREEESRSQLEMKEDLYVNCMN